MATDSEARMKVLEEEIGQLHTTLQDMGKNSRTTADVFGRRFAVPVDAEHKATQDPLCTTLCNCSNPHMRAFHTSWFGFFSSFYSTFAAASLSPYILPDLNMTGGEFLLSGTASVGGTIFFRLAMGWICEIFGARRGLGILLLATTPAIVGIMFTQSVGAFILFRTIIGFSLATFVACQTWCAQMFSKRVVGIANATAAGWGNLGGGVTNLTMPYVFLFFASFVSDPATRNSVGWRLSYFVPLAFHVVGGLLVLTARDLPDGNYRELEKIGAKQKGQSGTVLKVGASNINAWLLTITYGMCFGIELTMNNVAAKYFYTYQGLTPQLSGLCASCWGLMNIIARSIGGWISDWANAKAGMRGRLWACWIVQTLEGVFCIILGMITISFDAPFNRENGVTFDGHDGMTIGAWAYLGANPIRKQLGLPNGWVDINKTFVEECSTYPRNFTTIVPLTIGACNTLTAVLDDGLRECLYISPDQINILRKTAPPEIPGAPQLNCISNSGTVGLIMFMVVMFSLCVQAAEGLHYGIVPYVSRPALGIVSGMVGAGGNTGSVVAGLLFFRGQFRYDAGIINMGIMIIALTALLFFVYFPDMGSMLTPAGFLGSYDPQIIKPPADYRGADAMDYEAAAKNKAAQEAKENGTTTAEVEISKA